MGLTPGRRRPRHDHRAGPAGRPDLRRHRVPRDQPATWPPRSRAGAVPVAHVEHARRASGAVRRARAGDGEPALRRHVPAGGQLAASRCDGRSTAPAARMVAGPIDRRFGLDDGVVVDHAGHADRGHRSSPTWTSNSSRSHGPTPSPRACRTSGSTSTRASAAIAGASGPVRTALTEQFGIAHPIVSAGMARVAQAPLVAAVSEAGGMGCLGGVSYFADALRDEIRAIRRRHQPAVRREPARAPVAGRGRRRVVGAGAAPLAGPLRRRARASSAASSRCSPPVPCSDQVEVVLDERPAAVVLTFDVPRLVRDRCHERDIKVMALVGSVSRAVQADRGRSRLHRRPGDRGRWPHRLRRHDGPRAGGGRRRRGARPGRRRHRRRARAGRRALPRRPGRVDGHPLHRQHRGLRPSRLQAAGGRRQQQGHRHQPGLHRQAAADACRTSGPGVGASAWTRSSRSLPSTRWPAYGSRPATRTATSSRG